MIRLKRLNGDQIVLNADLIELVESTPDTLIHLTTGKKLMVREAVEEVIELIVEFKRSYHGGFDGSDV